VHQTKWEEPNAQLVCSTKPNESNGVHLILICLADQNKWTKWRSFDPPFGLADQTKWTKWRPFDPPFGHLVFGGSKQIKQQNTTTKQMLLAYLYLVGRARASAAF